MWTVLWCQRQPVLLATSIALQTQMDLVSRNTGAAVGKAMLGGLSGLYLRCQSRCLGSILSTIRLGPARSEILTSLTRLVMVQRDKHFANKGWFNPEDFIIQKVTCVAVLPAQLHSSSCCIDLCEK